MAERDQSKNKTPALDPDQRVRKRGRPPMMISYPSLRGRSRGRPPSSTGTFRNLVSDVETGTSFVPLQLTVNVGEDLIEKVSTFAKTCSQTVCVLSAVGSVSSVVFRKPGSPSTDTVTWEGRFEILSLSGKYTFVPGDAPRVPNWWNLALSDCHGAVFGGSVVGPVIVASPVDLILASFKLKSVEKMRKRAAESFATAAAAAADFSHMETGTETVSDKYPMIDGKKCHGSPTFGLSPATDIASESATPKTTDKTSDSFTPKTTDKTPGSITSTMKGHEEGSSAVADYSVHGDIDLEKAPNEDPKGEGEKQSGRSPTFGLLTTDKSPECVTPKTTDDPQKKVSSETIDKPQEELSSETVDKPPENVTPATSDKPENVTPATSDKSPENVTPATTRNSPENVVVSASDTSLPVMACHFNQASDDVPVNQHL